MYTLKYLVLIPDGMADTPVPSLDNRTPMEAAHKPTMDALAKKSVCGTVLNVPSGMVPESDTANLAILSYDPRTYSKGRSPLEAMSQGLEMSPADTALRCNFVTLSGDAETDVYEERVILDHSSDEITTAEAAELVKALNEALPMPGRTLYTGVSYRHCLLWENACETYDFMRPHDILGRVIGEYLPKEDNGGAEFLAFMKEGAKILEHHPINEARRARGLRPANSPWLWSPGKKPALPSFPEKWGVRAAIISAVDLIKGIGICANCDVIDVEGATGNFATNYTGKADAAVDAFKNGCDLVYVHVEAPDEWVTAAKRTSRSRLWKRSTNSSSRPFSSILKRPAKISASSYFPTIRLRLRSAPIPPIRFPSSSTIPRRSPKAFPPTAKPNAQRRITSSPTEAPCFPI